MGGTVGDRWGGGQLKGTSGKGDSCGGQVEGEVGGSWVVQEGETALFFPENSLRGVHWTASHVRTG